MTLAEEKNESAAFRGGSARVFRLKSDPRKGYGERKCACRPPIERFIWIAKMLRQGYRLTATTIAVRFETTVKTAYRDIEFLRNRLGYEITWDGHADTYRLESAPSPQL